VLTAFDEPVWVGFDIETYPVPAQPTYYAFIMGGREYTMRNW